MSADVIAEFVGHPDVELRRAEAIEAAQSAYDTLLPASLDADAVPSLDIPTRLLIAARTAVVESAGRPAAHYLGRLRAIGATAYAALAIDGPDQGAGLAAAPAVRALVRLTDRLVLRPAASTQTDLHGLIAAGWSEADIVVASQVSTFVSYQVRVAHGLAVLTEVGA